MAGVLIIGLGTRSSADIRSGTPSFESGSPYRCREHGETGQLEMFASQLGRNRVVLPDPEQEIAKAAKISKDAEEEEIEILDRIIEQLSRRAKEIRPSGGGSLLPTKSEMIESESNKKLTLQVHKLRELLKERASLHRQELLELKSLHKREISDMTEKHQEEVELLESELDRRENEVQSLQEALRWVEKEKFNAEELERFKNLAERQNQDIERLEHFLEDERREAELFLHKQARDAQKQQERDRKEIELLRSQLNMLRNS
mmetsp:Transcript_31303/g.70464  ORF Transcript_31303/g.70464 Transcript_31303/m.70464 type:complete len:260 (-) Transcript_31303:100-879(-)